MNTLIIIPAYNEEESLGSTVSRLTATVPDVDYLVVNDGSIDGTAQICRDNGYPFLDLPCNLGLAGAFQAGIKYAYRHGYDCAIQFDADGQHMPEYISKMAEAMRREGADIIIASRNLAGGGAVGARGTGAKLITFFINCATKQTITDPTSGMRMYNRSMIEKFARDFDIAPEPDTISLLIRKGAKVIEIPAQMRERQGGTSYLRYFSAISYMARTCLSLLLFQWFR